MIEHIAEFLIKRRPLFVKYFTMHKVRVGKNQPEIKPKVDFSTKINKKEEFICNTAKKSAGI